MTVGSTTVGSTTVGSTTVGSTTVGSTTDGSMTVGSATVGSTTVGSTTVGSTTVGSTTVGSTTVGSGINTGASGVKAGTSGANSGAITGEPCTGAVAEDTTVNRVDEGFAGESNNAFGMRAVEVPAVPSSTGPSPASSGAIGGESCTSAAAGSREDAVKDPWDAIGFSADKSVDAGGGLGGGDSNGEAAD
jgi:hypothetical protein